MDPAIYLYESPAEHLHPLTDGLVSGECFRLIEKDPETQQTYLHYFTKKETWDFIEINFLTTAGEINRQRYFDLF